MAHEIFIERFNTYFKQVEISVKEEFRSKSSGKGENPITVRRYRENDILIEIFNFPALFNLDFGFLHLLNHLQVLFNVFFDKNKDLETQEKKGKFFSFFTSLIDEDNETIENLTGVRYDDDKLYFLKNAMDLLISYFDLESVKTYYLSKSFIENNGSTNSKLAGSIILGTASLIAFGTFFAGINSSLLLIGGGIGILISIGLTAYFCYKKYKVNKGFSKIEEDEQKVKENMKFIEKFFDRMKVENEKEYKCNVFIIAIDKTGDNYGDFIFQHYNLKGINSIDSPKLDNYTDNMSNYKCYLN